MTIQYIFLIVVVSLLFWSVIKIMLSDKKKTNEAIVLESLKKYGADGAVYGELCKDVAEHMPTTAVRAVLDNLLHLKLVNKILDPYQTKDQTYYLSRYSLSEAGYARLEEEAPMSPKVLGRDQPS